MGSFSRPFDIAMGVRQGCPLAPYLFLIVREILNIHTQLVTQEGLIRNLKLPTVPLFQVISQYVDDSTLFLEKRGEFRKQCHGAAGKILLGIRVAVQLVQICYVPKTKKNCHEGSFGKQKLFIFKLFWLGFFSHKLLTKSLNISST
jgi:hypothetical protein